MFGLKKYVSGWLNLDMYMTSDECKYQTGIMIDKIAREIADIKSKSHTHSQYNAMTETEVMLYKHIKAIADHIGAEFNRRDCECGGMSGHGSVVYCVSKKKK